MMRIVFLSLILSFLLVGDIAFSQNQQLIDSLKRVLKTSQNDSIKAAILNKLSDSYFTYDNNTSIQYAQEAYDISSRGGFKTEMGNAHANLGWVYLNRDNYPEAFKNFRATIKLINETDDKKGVIRCYVGMGHAYLGQSNYAEALKNYFEATKINDATGDSYSKDVLYQCIAMVYNDEGNYAEALKYYFESLKTAEAPGRESSRGTIYINMAGTYLNLNNYEKAQEYNLLALKMAEEMNDLQGKAFAYSQIGIVNKQQANYSVALDYFFQGLAIAEKQGFKLIEIDILKQIGTTCLIQKEFDRSRSYLEKSLAISREIGSIENISQCYKHLSELDSAQGNSTRSLESYKLHILYRDSAFNLESVRKSEQARMQYEMDKKDADVKAEQERKDAIAERELQKQKIVKNAFVGGFIFVLVFAGVFFRQRNKISKARKRSDELLLNILPSEVAEELKEKGSAAAKQFDCVTVMFTDFKNFTQISERLSAAELVSEIDNCFKAFDNIITRYNIEKIKTIGDSYMCAGGLPVANRTNAADVLSAALEIQQFMQQHLLQRNHEGKEPFEIRIGIHTGPVVAGIVGLKKFAYDIWGDTVNIASRMESSGEAGKINISGSTYELVKDKFTCIHRGKISAKNKGEIDMYFVESSDET